MFLNYTEINQYTICLKLGGTAGTLPAQFIALVSGGTSLQSVILLKRHILYRGSSDVNFCIHNQKTICSLVINCIYQIFQFNSSFFFHYTAFQDNANIVSVLIFAFLLSQYLLIIYACLCFVSFDHLVSFRFSLFSTMTLIFLKNFPYCSLSRQFLPVIFNYSHLHILLRHLNSLFLV